MQRAHTHFKLDRQNVHEYTYLYGYRFVNETNVKCE